MARKKLKKDKNGHQILCLNLEAIKNRFFEKKGKIPSKGVLANETARTTMTLDKYEKELPPTITFVANLMKELDMTFEEVTKQAYE